MRRIGRFLVLVLVAVGPRMAVGVDAPHDASSPLGILDCQSCHVGHNAPGASMTKTAGNVSLCESCHQDPAQFDFPWNASDQATPGVGGRSHRWDALATNLGATPPDPNSADPGEAAMGMRLDAGKLQCSTCHDQHQADIYRGTVHTSKPLNTDILSTGTGILRLSSVGANAKAAGYVIRLSTASTFQISHDNGLSYLGYNDVGAFWEPGNPAGKLFTPLGTPVTLDDAEVAVTFSGSPTAGEVFDPFYVSYPFLRADNTDSKMCVTCHRNRDMNHIDVEGGVANGLSGGRLGSVTLGTTVFSHPVGITLNANGRGYDRTKATLLDADGSAQSSGTDTNTTNDLRLGSGDIVHCMTCHHPHNADSNSLTVDKR